MSVSKFTYRRREFKDFKDVEEAVWEIVSQSKKEFLAISKSGVPASSVIVQASPIPSSRTGMIPISEETVNYRTDTIIATAGVNTITFRRPLPTSSYVISWALIASNGELSSATPDITSFSVSGFNITCLEAGTLYYRADIPR